MVQSEFEEFLSGSLVVSEHPQHGGRYSFTVNFLHTTHYHAHVPENEINSVSVW